jgi:dCMP deaminase
MEYERPSWNQYFTSITRMVATRSTCLRRHVGAILVKEKRILATGYNGAPAGLKHCIEVGCIREEASIPSGTRHELCRALHAEQNAIVQAAYHGTPIAGSTLYCTNKPCVICSKMLINAGIERIFFDKDYDDDLADAILDEAGIEIMRFET